MDTRRPKLGEMLQRAGLLNDLQLRTALAEQHKWGGRLGKILVDMNYATEDLIIKALCRQLNVARANLDNVQVPPQVLMKLDRAFCEQHLCVPCAYGHNERALQVAMGDPTNLRSIDELKFRTGLRIVPALAGEKAIAATIARLYASEQLADDSDEEFKLLNAGGATLMKNVADIVPASGFQAPAPSAPPPPAPAWGVLQVPEVPAPAPPPPAAAPAEDLAAQQRNLAKGIKALLELLMERGVFTREEYVAWLNRR